MILIVDFGSQTTHLIGRRLKDLGVDTKIIEPKQVLKLLADSNFKPSGIILSGGPASVYEAGSPTIQKSVFDSGLPILGICYGWQLTAQLLGGQVISGKKEYGPVSLEFNNQLSLFAGIPGGKIKVWMSHGDEVVKLPKGFKIIGKTSRVKAAAVANQPKHIFGLQFHPEVMHTDHGTQILKNFAEKICGLKTSKFILNAEELVESTRAEINAISKTGKAVAAVSGGVDSAVAGAIVGKAIGKRFTPVYCDNGLMRVGAREEVIQIFQKQLGIDPIIIDCKAEFLAALKGVIDPEQKRKIIGNLYIKFFEKVAAGIKDAKFLVQGTIYSDVIESQGTKHASKIKSHHNVGGLPEKMHLQLIEPVRNLYKDEVREIGRQLGLPAEVLSKQPFPGPGQAIRIIGEITAERLEKQQKADQIVLEVLHETGWYEKVFQSFPVMTGIKTTAVKGDGRIYAELVGLRIYDGQDIMTAGWSHLPYEVLQQISSRIVSGVPDVSRVVYDITTKPPATMEWE